MFDLISRYDNQILDAFWVTIKLTFFSAIGALVIGTVVAGMRVSPIPVARWVGAAYVAVCLPAFGPETVHRDDDV